MKNSIFKVLGALAVLSFILACVMHYGFPYSKGAYILALPFALIGSGLRWLSLWSAFGNVLAFVFYIGLSLIPLVFLLYQRKTKGRKKADVILLLITLYNFFFFYFLVNPVTVTDRYFSFPGGASVIPTLRMTLVVFYAALWIGYLLVYMTETVTVSPSYNSSEALNRLLRKLLLAAAVLYTIIFFYFNSIVMLLSVDKAITDKVSATAQIFPVADYILSGIPVVFTIIIFLYGAMLLKAMTGEHLQEEENMAAIRLGEAGKKCIYATVCCNILSNALQLLLAKQLNNIAFQADLSSLFPLVIAIFSMILAAYFKEAKELKESDELFI